MNREKICHDMINLQTAHRFFIHNYKTNVNFGEPKLQEKLNQIFLDTFKPITEGHYLSFSKKIDVKFLESWFD